MPPSNLRDRLLGGTPCLGTFLQLGAPGIVEVVGRSGFDFAIVDLEHGGLGVSDAVGLVRAADAVGMPMLVRVPLGQLSATSALLDSGYRGLLVPQIKTADDVREVVSKARYAPLGERGACAGIRGDRYASMTWDEHLADAEQTVVAVTIETQQALANVEEIVAVKGIDVIFVGVFDLAASMGMPGQPTHPDVIAAVRTIHAVVEGSGVALGAWAPSPDDARAWLDMGMTFVPVSTDALLWAKTSAEVHQQWQGVLSSNQSTSTAAEPPG
jgi:4-hydroxy-2-oxoheptanedioate aldolase